MEVEQEGRSQPVADRPSLGALAVGDIRPDRRDIVAPSNVKRTGADTHISQAAVPVTMSRFEGEFSSVANGVQVRPDRLVVVLGLDVADAEAEKLLPGIPEPLVRGGVELGRNDPSCRPPRRSRHSPGARCSRTLLRVRRAPPLRAFGH